ncbi:30S ribosome-binding factor RbfA [Desulfitobacterium chlororespirans]|uniref:Ribosome-binding factor A n=1 Tax=Desulfitobacterium chlororespirans DSM 11544 TaxID=1121395 RepID=A0A1M7TLX7_9FIRM|nr:30S ribosome-binding factor RbfA [Desulfitobacterium chlororespirans]SHN71737.1 ribosome-binding factor A [Desulfitobacterium chlororespirans DSM 11544]
MAKHRSNRLAETLKQEISQLIREELKDPRIGFVTVTSVEVADDLGNAKVYVSVLGDSQQAKDSLDALKRAAGFVRSEIGKRVRLRHAPEIVFKYDTSIEHGAHIAQLLRGVKQEEEKDEGESHDE